MFITTSSAIATLLFAPLVLSASFNLFGGQTPIKVADDEFPVPGDNPLTFCADPVHDILTIERVDLDPNPPLPGQNLTITASGTFSKDVEEGAKVLLQVKYGLIRLINQEADLCEQIGNVDLHCPLEKGEMSLMKQVALPAEIPPGKYTVLADVYAKNKDRITCLESTIYFHV